MAVHYCHLKLMEIGRGVLQHPKHPPPPESATGYGYYNIINFENNNLTVLLFSDKCRTNVLVQLLR